MNLNLRYLLDTNIISDIVRNPQGQVADQIKRVGDNSICTSVIVACELRFGAEKKGSEKLLAQLEAVLSAIEILPFDKLADSQYALIRNQLEQVGTPIGPNDLLIAAQAIALDLVLITGNLKEFSRVKGLRVENWLLG